jgi:hypothetical protein
VLLLHNVADVTDFGGDAADEEQTRPLVCNPSLKAAEAEAVPSSLTLVAASLSPSLASTSQPEQRS